MDRHPRTRPGHPRRGEAGERGGACAAASAGTRVGRARWTSEDGHAPGHAPPHSPTGRGDSGGVGKVFRRPLDRCLSTIGGRSRGVPGVRIGACPRLPASPIPTFPIVDIWHRSPTGPDPYRPRPPNRCLSTIVGRERDVRGPEAMTVHDRDTNPDTSRGGRCGSRGLRASRGAAWCPCPAERRLGHPRHPSPRRRPRREAAHLEGGRRPRTP